MASAVNGSAQAHGIAVDGGNHRFFAFEDVVDDLSCFHHRWRTFWIRSNGLARPEVTTGAERPAFTRQYQHPEFAIIGEIQAKPSSCIKNAA